MQLIFDGKEVRARLIAGAPGAETLVVAFAAREIERKIGLGRRGFGEPFLAKAGIPAIHLTTAWNHWYLSAEMPAALAAVRAAAAPFRRIVAYGSSMGGYAALLHSRALGATRVVAISPRYSIDPARSAFDGLRREETARIDFGADDIEGGLAPSADLLLLSDIDRAEGHHIRLIEAASGGRARLLPMPFSGHPSGPFLHQAGLVASLVKALILEPDVDLASWRRRVRAARARAPAYWERMARRALWRGRARLAVAAAERLVALVPDDAAPAVLRGDALALAGRPDAALAEFRRGVGLAPRDPWAHERVARALAAAGQLDEALVAVEESIRLAPAISRFQRLRERLRSRLARPRTRRRAAEASAQP